MPPTPFGDGYHDGLHNRADFAHLYPAGAELEKYLEGAGYGAEDRAAGALEPLEQLG